LDLGGDYSELYVAFKYWPINITKTSFTFNVIGFFNSSNQLLGMVGRNLTTGIFYVDINESSPYLGSGSKFLMDDQTYLIEVRYKPSTAADGIFQLKINGVLEIDVQNQVTAGYSGNIRKICFGTISWDVNSADAYIGDIVIDDAVWPGNSKMTTIKPESGGTTTQWNPSTGANWDCVEEIPAAIGDYVGAASVDLVDTYGMSAMPLTPNAIKAVQVQAKAIKVGAPTPGNLQLAVRTGGTNYFSGDKAPPTIIPKHLWHVWATNPNTTTAWTKNDVDALEAGIKSVT